MRSPQQSPKPQWRQGCHAVGSVSRPFSVALGEGFATQSTLSRRKSAGFGERGNRMSGARFLALPKGADRARRSNRQRCNDPHAEPALRPIAKDERNHPRADAQCGR